MGFRIVHPDDRPLAIAMAERAVDFQTPTVLRYVRPDGRIVSVEHRNTPIFDDQGRVVAIEGIGRDVTETLAIHNRLRVSETQLRRLAAGLHSARESERAHVARELHDELGQTLTSLKIDLTRTVRDLIPHQLTPEMIDRMQSMVGGIEVATETVRRLATSLRPPALDHLGLAAAIELEGAALARRTGLRVRTSGNLRTTRLTAEQTTAVFRIVQEALTNVVRHADASAVRIVMRQTPQHISVNIQDNGRGSAPRRIDDPASIGLLGMRERAELIGARLAISGRAGQGHGGPDHGPGQTAPRRAAPVIRILLVDDHPVVRHGIRQILIDGMKSVVVGEASDVPTASARIRSDAWDVVVLDLTLPGRAASIS